MIGEARQLGYRVGTDGPAKKLTAEENEPTKNTNEFKRGNGLNGEGRPTLPTTPLCKQHIFLKFS